MSQFVFSIPKILRRYFLYGRSLLSELSCFAWEGLWVFSQGDSQEDGVPGALIAIQMLKDFLGFNLHCHIICTDGCFDGKGLFRVAPRFNPEDLKAIFEHHVFRMLIGKGKITQNLVLMLRSWRHSGFQLFVGPRILFRVKEVMEKLAHYIIRASFSQERMTYLPEAPKVIYQSKDAKRRRPLTLWIGWLP